MRGIILPGKVSREDLARCRRNEKESVAARDRHILEFPLSMSPNAVAKALRAEDIEYRVRRLRDARRQADRGATDRATLARPVTSERARQVRRSPLPSRREYRHVCERAGKSGKQIERCVIASFHVAESMGFKGEFRQWEYLLRIGD
jgi:hypothetical protein